MNILYIVPYVPNLVRVRSYNIIRQLASAGHRVTLATLWTDSADYSALENLRNECHQVYGFKLTKWRSLYNCASSLPTKIPLQASFCWHPGMSAQIEHMITKSGQQFDVVHVEHLRGVRFGLALKSALSHPENSAYRNLPILWDSVDCISSLFRQTLKKSKSFVSRMLAMLDVERTSQYERWLVRQFDQVLVTSVVDKNAFLFKEKNESKRPDICVIPNGVDLEYFKPETNGSRQHSALVLTGKMSYHANVTMALQMVESVMPIIWSQKPEVKLWIVGKDPPVKIRELGRNPAIKVTGTVDDIRSYLLEATIAVAPLSYGAGIQNKVLEAMACGTPVITTSLAVSALSVEPGKEVLLADEPEKFAKEVLDLLANPDRQKYLSAMGRKYVELNHNWKDIVAKIEERYHQAVSFKTAYGN